MVLCDSLDDALEGHARDAAGLRFATPDGCIVWPSGKVTLGATAAEDEEGALARARRLEDARVRHGAAQEALAQALAAAEEAEEALRKAQAESLALSQELAQKRGAADAARAEADRAEEKLAAVRRELEDVERQRAAAEQSIAETRPNVDALAERVDALAPGSWRSRRKACGRPGRRRPLRDEAQRASEALSEARLSAATLAERETYTSRVREAREREIKQLANADAEARATLRKKKAAMCASSLCSPPSKSWWTARGGGRATWRTRPRPHRTPPAACMRPRTRRARRPARRRPPSTRRTSA